MQKLLATLIARSKGPDFADARFDTDIPLDALEAGETAPVSTVAASEPAADPDDAPAFVRDAERVARWQSSGARKALFALMGNAPGLADDEMQRAFLTDTLGREVESRATLTEAEAARAIERLRAWASGDEGAKWVAA